MAFIKRETNQGNIVENSETGSHPKGHLIYDKNDRSNEPVFYILIGRDCVSCCFCPKHIFLVAKSEAYEIESWVKKLE